MTQAMTGHLRGNCGAARHRFSTRPTKESGPAHGRKWAMPRFEPFSGIRYDVQKVDPALVSAPPYDVIDDDDRAALVAQDPHNAVRIDLPADEDGLDRYDVAPRLFAEWLESGVLRQDAKPSFYAYAMDFVGDDGTPRQTLGVFGALELHAPGEGGILPHEHTTPKARSDRLTMLQVCRANLSAVWGLSPAPGLSDLLRIDDDPVADFVDSDEVRHRYWVIDGDDRIAAIAELVSAVPFVIADGHHRYETSLAYRAERRADGDHDGPAESALVYAVELSEEQLSVRPIHRLISGTLDPEALVGRLGTYFEVEELGDTTALSPSTAGEMAERGSLVLVLAQRSYWLTPRATAFDGIRDLDTSRLDAALDGLDDHELTFQHGIDHVVTRVQRGDATAGVLLRPATAAQILEIAEGAERMPPKTTFFYPKVKTGLVFRSLD
jgi:uncharacterized protein (DUF1015 family)